MSIKDIKSRLRQIEREATMLEDLLATKELVAEWHDCSDAGLIYEADLVEAEKMTEMMTARERNTITRLRNEWDALSDEEKGI